MMQEPTYQPRPCPLEEGDPPTQPRMRALYVPAEPDPGVLHERHSRAYRVCIHEHGIVKLLLPGHEAMVLEPAEAFDLLDFLFEHRSLLAAQSAQIAERQEETQKTYG